MKKVRLGILLLSLTLGIVGTYATLPYFPSESPARREQLAWWGGLYPEYCLPGAMELKGEETREESEKIPVRLSFRYLTFLNRD